MIKSLYALASARGALDLLIADLKRAMVRYGQGDVEYIQGLDADLLELDRMSVNLDVRLG